jgi:hypothetical protein
MRRVNDSPASDAKDGQAEGEDVGWRALREAWMQRHPLPRRLGVAERLKIDHQQEQLPIEDRSDAQEKLYSAAAAHSAYPFADGMADV